jgi:hypothetical protein
MCRYYEGDKELPYIAEAPNYYLESAVQEIFNHEVKRDVCSKQPIGVVTSSTFFVDLSKLEHRADIRSDDLGVWINKGVRSTYSRILFDDDKIKKIVKMPSKPSVMSPSVYRLKRSYWVHAEDHSFQRRLIELEDYKGNVHNVCILQYIHPTEARIHSKNYIRTKQSVLQKIRNEATGSKPTETFDKIYEECGGIMGVQSLGSLPKNKKQVSNLKSAIKSTCDVNDPLFTLMEQCKNEESKVNPFIRNVQGAPDAMCVLANEKQLNDLRRFCCDPNEFSVLGVDPTFNLGDFSVTVTTYRHLQLLERNTCKPPVFLGPMLIHQRKTTQSYHFLASSIVGLCPELVSLKAFGTDGERALGNAFSTQFQEATHLVCFLHVKDAIKRKLREIGISGNNINDFLNDIFGKQEGTHQYKGLVDATNDVEFNTKLSNLKSVWNQKESAITSTTNPVFFEWFVDYQVDLMINKMIKPVRQKAGLGNIPAQYTNNANESANARIKHKVDYKKNEVNIFCNKMKELVDAQFRNVERAFTLNSGPYKVSTKYESFAENPSKWVKKSTHLKELYINRIYKLELITTEQPCTSRSSPELDVNEHNPVEEAEPVAVTELSISLKDAGLSEPALVDVWNKAAKIVGDKNSITNAPGLNSSKMVVSYSNPRKPHIVTHYANGKFTCDCQNYLTKNLCAHALATAESLHQLSTFIQWHIKNMPKLVCGNWQDLLVYLKIQEQSQLVEKGQGKLLRPC